MRRRSVRPTVDLPHPDSPTRFLRVDVERHVVDRFDVPDRAPHQPALDGEIRLEVVDLK